MKWKKILQRPDIDLLTASSVDKTFYKNLWEFTGKKEEVFFTYSNKKFMTHYSKVDFLRVGRYLYDKVITKENIEKNYRYGKILLQKAEKSKTYDEFLEQYDEINELFSITPWIAIEAWQSDFEKIVKRLAKKNHINTELEDTLYAITKPWKKTAILKIKDDFKKGMPIKDLVQKYQFLASWTIIWYKPITKEWMEEIVSSKDIDEPKLSFDDTIKILNPSNKEIKFLEMAPYVTFFKDYRDDVRRKFSFVWRPFFKNLAKKWNIDYDDLGYLTYDEIRKWIKGSRDLSIIEYRKNNPIILTTIPPKLNIIVTDKFKKYESIVKSCEEKKKVMNRGIIAQPGTARGKAKIVRTYHDTKYVNRGDIIIANTTHPNYPMAMKKAAAIVTNEGGLISHASIVSRELKIPCIVGTKNATEIFKDGDLVEVDANKGVVRKLN